jgi:hypothetical protein
MLFINESLGFESYSYVDLQGKFHAQKIGNKTGEAIRWEEERPFPRPEIAARPGSRRQFQA